MNDAQLAGSEAIVWAFQRRADAQGSYLLRFAYMCADDTPHAWFRRLPMEPVIGKVANAVVLGEDLHVFFSDGTHRRYMPVHGSAWSRPRPPVHISELILAGGALPLASTADSVRPVLYVLVTSADLAPLTQGETEREEAVHTAPAESREVDGWTDASGDQSASECTLVRYESGRWHIDRAAPPDLGPHTARLGMLAAEGVIHMIYQPNGDDHTYIHSTSTDAGAAWEETSRLSVDYAPVVHAAGWFQGEPALILGRSTLDGVTLQTRRWHNKEWTRGTALTNDAGEPAVFKPPLSVATFGSLVAVLTVDSNGDALVGMWGLPTGKPMRPLSRIAALIPIPRSRLHSPMRVVIQYALLAGILTAVFVWRRSSILTPAALKPGQAPARFSLRAAALLIDIVILTPVWGMLLFFLIEHSAPQAPLTERFRLGSQAVAPDSLWFWALLGMIVALYALILEGVTGSTAGKKLTGLRVVGCDGERCRFAQILIRNAVRVIEFPVAPLVLLVALTPSRQRLGDIIAQTVVVEWAGTMP